MDKNKIIIIALIVVIIAFLVGIFATMPNMNKQSTNLTFISNSTINEGDNIEFKLTDANGNLLVNQKVNVTVTDKNQTSDYHSVVTNDNGIGVLEIDKSAGEYEITVDYGGSNDYDSCTATQNITIKEKVAEAESYSSSSSSTTPRYTTDEHGTYDTVNDVYIDRQFEGMSKSEVREFEAKIERDGGMI